MGPSNSPERYFSRKEAASLCGVSPDTIKRAEARGDLPGARTRPGCPNKTIEIPYTDLVNAGLYEPLAAGDEPDEQLRRIQDGQQVQKLTAQLAAASALNDERSERIRFLEGQNRQQLKSIERLASLIGGDR